MADVPNCPNGLCMLPGGVLAIAACVYATSASSVSKSSVTFVAARNDSYPQALAACRASSLATTPFEWPMGLALTNDGLLVCNQSYLNQSTALYTFAKDGSMDELATVPVLAGYGLGFKRCAVHQQTQRTYALGEDEAGSHTLVLFDANLQVIATIVDTGDVPEDIDEDDDEYEPIRDVAVHGDQVIVLSNGQYAKGSGMQLLDLDGRFLRTIAAGQFRNPEAVAVSHGRAFVVDDDDEPGKVLHVIDIQSGDTIQRVRVDFCTAVSAMIVDGDEIYLAGFGAGEVVVLQLAGSDA